MTPLPIPPPGPRRSSAPRGAAIAACLALALGSLAGALPVAADDTPDNDANDTVETVAVDFSESTGLFRGGASGMLYGLGDDGMPTDAIIAGARPTNVTQKAPRGAQHPNGDPLEVERSFFENGGEYLMVNIQDYYPDWFYNGGKRPADFSTYLDIVRTVVADIRDNSAYPEKYVFTPFNEPDGGNWYGGEWSAQRDIFLEDWKTTYGVIKEVYPEARIAGMGDAVWRSARTRDILEFAKANDVLPDIWTWHELGIENLATFRSHLEAYRAYERELGIDPLPVNITEYAMRRDMSVPGQLVQWLAMFEDEKVDAQTAYWTFAGNLNDNMAKGNAANGAWWLLKWYGDLTGETVALTPPQLNAVDTVQGIATIDEERRQAVVVVGGGSEDIRLDLSGLDPAVFGETVDVQVRESAWTGQEGEAGAPRVVVAERTALSGELEITVPNDDRRSAYQVVVTPAQRTQPAVDGTWRTEVEAEETRLTGATVREQPANDAWVFAASGERDVAGLTSADSSLTWDVEVPEDGSYRLGITAGVDGPNIGPGSHALFVDGEFVDTISYEAGFGSTYRGRAELVAELSEGAHELSVRTSADGLQVLPGSNVSVDKLDLEQVSGPDENHYPAALARTSVAPLGDGTVPLDGDATATFFVSARDNGYHDVVLSYDADGAADIALSVNGRAIAGLAADAAGERISTARVHLREGINEIEVSSAGAIGLQEISTVRTAEADDAITRIEAEDEERVALAGSARREDVAGPTNVSGQQIGWLGGGPGNTATISRSDDLPAGSYDLQVRYSNAEKNTGHAYNADVITRFLDVTEAGFDAQRGAFRHNYSWKGFWTHSVPLDLAGDGDIVLGNADTYAPNLDWVAFAPLTLAVSNEPVVAPAEPVLEVTSPPTKTEYAVGEEFSAEGLVISRRTGDATVPLAPDAYSLSGFDSSAPGEVTVTVSAEVDGRRLTATFSVTIVAGSSAPQPGATPTVSLSTRSVAPGESVTVTAGGFAPESGAEIWLNSDPVLLERSTTDADGALTLSVTVPSGTAAGSHRVIVRVGDAAAEALLDVVIAAPRPAGTIATTGGAVPVVAALLAAGLLAAGGALMARRRRMTRA
ncbi:bacterial Ig-like domain-containing protein [Microbacterium arborescens]|uniref:bacterial Ig-like domain-containing protein n=1 Tax=Microbacterium arborescens TaxID=33883 RepID=UPI002782A494|nr:bacterial Ig-like domain-containing protein [Microbacterium arborescens]MDQ1218327.1 hypothetical protein [Microbacterium arborescens]